MSQLTLLVLLQSDNPAAVRTCAKTSGVCSMAKFMFSSTFCKRMASSILRCASMLNGSMRSCACS